ncbi:COP23 domain-containing protein [Anabaena sp. UHCC 0451]|uniref:COP23 domain-containing protein n=1 Tax=Anabaena sp. UHCC 0451 TaxID=2055235 RepID=UPI002B1E9E19|nr:COP23 domain-containing protein [Anabaena sp. UHCC 0451]MEA5576629.1 COP23 domain-containing protein [Anabaena sp. UHCC 0451]
MSSKSRQFLLSSSLIMSLFIGNSVAFAQSDSVVVPTVPSGSTTTVPSGSPTNIPPTSTTPIDSSTRFSCQYYNGQYTVMYQPQSRQGQFFAWAAPQALGGGWTAQNRCEAIANRLELYRPDGLQELQIARENNENIICVTTEANPGCRILLTVPRNKDPQTIRSSIFSNLASADNGQQTTAVNTYANRGQGGVNELYNLGRTLLGGANNRPTSSRNGINLKPFLAPEDGGTATNLRNGVSIGRQSPPQNRTILNPRLFR